jgi:hypothetical protein
MDVSGAQAGLQVANRDVFIKSGQGAGKTGRRVPLDQDQIRVFSLLDIPNAEQDPAGNIKKILVWLHDIQVIIRGDGKEIQNLVKHLAMLGRHADP